MGNNNTVPLTNGVATDWEKYAGIWYEQARIPSWFEKKEDGNVTAEYNAISGKQNQLEVKNRSTNTRTNKTRLATGNAEVDTKRDGVLRVKFSFWQPRADYIVIAHGNNYDWTLVGSRSRKQLWLLTRDQLPASSELLLQMTALARSNGYSEDTLNRFERTPRI